MTPAPHFYRQAFTLVLTALSISACGETSQSTQPVLRASTHAEAARREAMAALGQGRSRVHIRDQLNLLSMQVPGFTGLFVDSEGKLTIAASRELTPAGIDVILAWGRSYASAVANASASTIRFRRVAYSYSELYDRFKIAEQSIQPDDGLTLTAIDEARGVIVLGLKSLSRVSELRTRLAAAGVPFDMLELRQQDIGRGELTLTSAVRPTAGGTQTRHHNAGFCTLGFNVGRWDEGWNNSPYYFFTAAHCQGASWGQNQQLPVSQPENYHVGQEFEVAPIRNYPASPCTNPAKSPCEAADLVVYKYDDTVAVRYGQVARPDASLNILGYTNVQPYVTGAIQGQVITVVGSASGQVTGTVSLTCSDQQVATMDHPSPVWVLCLGEANYSGATGDSGAPIFVPYNPSQPNQTPALVGIHSNTSGTHRYYTTISQIDAVTNYGYYYW